MRCTVPLQVPVTMDVNDSRTIPSGHLRNLKVAVAEKDALSLQ